MNKRQYVRFFVLAATMLCLLLAAAYGQQSGKAGKKEYTFRGKVEKVDANGRITLTATTSRFDFPSCERQMISFPSQKQ